MQKTIILLFCSVFLGYSCHSNKTITSDKSATKGAQDLYKRLEATAGKGIMIGHQDALAYGLGWWKREGMCDMYRVSGEYPAVYGWEIGDIHTPRNLDSVAFSDMKNWMIDIHKNGGINAISFHMDNPVDGASSWDTSKITKDILPGGKDHQKLLFHLDLAANFIKSIQTDAQAVPMIYRPFHEHNGNWFWWGKGNTTEADYIALFQFNVDYFRKKHNIHNLIYAFSPDRSRMKSSGSRTDYLYGYPGDDYVDLLGWDNYMDVKASNNDSLNAVGIKSLVTGLEMIADLAAEKGKLCALTETGSESIKDPKWFTQRILNPIKASPKASKITYVSFWRNARESHHYMSYPGHITEADFKDFVKDPMTLTLKDIGTNFVK